jgi:4,5-dihydroxyphthalate decarboxylase
MRKAALQRIPGREGLVPKPLRLLFGGPYDRVADVPSVASELGLAVENHYLGRPGRAFKTLSTSNDGDGGEMSASFYMTRRSQGGAGSDLVALPIWVSRAFRHGNIFVRSDSDITHPGQLRNRRIGLAEYGMTMAVWLRGIFADQYDLMPADVEWVTHRSPIGLDPSLVKLPADVAITEGAQQAHWDGQLRTGAVDAWIGAGETPLPVDTRKLFLDWLPLEREYFQKTHIFPLMHLLVLRRSVIESDPEIAAKLVSVFEIAKQRACRRLWSGAVSYVTMPWTMAAMEEQSELMEGDVWPYGLVSNRPTLETLVRYMSEQQLLWNELSVPQFFPPVLDEDIAYYGKQW